MKKITTQTTIRSFINQENKKIIIELVIAFIKNYVNHNNCVCMSLDKICDIQTALDEVLKNVVAFAYPNMQGEVSISITIYSNNVLKLEVCDYGCGIKNIDIVQPLLGITNDRYSSMGFKIMKVLSDDLIVKTTLGKGTTVTMEFEM